ncbi:MAG: hypothetical protein J6S83_01405 [Lachnospiraceae bacterium]|nr:hypothetical protein [Lachnospiraceae bacterium]
MNIRKIIRKLFTGKQKSQEELKQEYEMQTYDHYQAFGNAFVNFCSGR